MTKIEKYLAQYANENDKGANGKAFECAIREFFAHRSVKAIKSQGKADCYFTYTENGKTCKVTVEIKTACGEIATAHKSQYIIYCPEVDVEMEAECQGYVFSRQEWVEFVNGYTGRGSFTRVNSRGELHIQSFRSEGRPKASKPIAEYIWETCMEKPTAEEWCEGLRGE